MNPCIMATHSSRTLVPRVDYEKLSGNKMSETSEVTRQRVQAARERKRSRFSKNGLSDIIANADMCIGEIRQFCQLQLCRCEGVREQGCKACRAVKMLANHAREATARIVTRMNRMGVAEVSLERQTHRDASGV